MAIYDNNGTTNAEISKLYDNNSTTSSQIGKVYDNNGTADSLVYTAETVVIDTAAGVVENTWREKSYDNTDELVDGYANVTDGVSLWVKNNYGGVTEQMQRDFSQYSKATFNVSLRNSVNNELWETWFGVITSNLGDAYKGPTMVVRVDVTGTGTFTLDLSGYNGMGYLSLYQRGFGFVRINKIVLE